MYNDIPHEISPRARVPSTSTSRKTDQHFHVGIIRLYAPQPKGWNAEIQLKMVNRWWRVLTGARAGRQPRSATRRTRRYYSVKSRWRVTRGEGERNAGHGKTSRRRVSERTSGQGGVVKTASKNDWENPEPRPCAWLVTFLAGVESRKADGQ